MIWIECSALVAAMNRKILTGSRFPLAKKAAAFQELALLGDCAQLTAQPPQLLTLVGGQAGAGPSSASRSQGSAAVLTPSCAATTRCTA
jgi:hypothetical protein